MALDMWRKMIHESKAVTKFLNECGELVDDDELKQLYEECLKLAPTKHIKQALKEYYLQRLKEV